MQVKNGATTSHNLKAQQHVNTVGPIFVRIVVKVNHGLSLMARNIFMVPSILNLGSLLIGTANEA